MPRVDAQRATRSEAATRGDGRSLGNLSCENGSCAALSAMACRPMTGEKTRRRTV